MVAPEIPGIYQSYWQMQAPNGERIGDQVYVKIASKSTLLSAPILLKPEKEEYQWVVQFEWRWENELLEDGRFSIRIWPDEESGPGDSKIWTKENSWQTSDLPNEGWYRCHVVVLRVWTDEKGQKQCEEISARSKEWRFYFVPPPHPTSPRPTATPPQN